MDNQQFSRNLRRLRLEKGLTQEQLAAELGVSVQSVSRWECGNTLPDVMLLPRIARLYHVTVDDLYRAELTAYSSYAQRLLSVYEASGRTEDFLSAEQEFIRTADSLTPDDLRSWGVLYHYMLKSCARMAQQKLDQAMAHPDVTDQIYCSSALQKNAVLFDLGKGKEEAARYDRELEENPSDVRLWILGSAAHLLNGNLSRALETALEGIRRFPERAVLYVHAGDTLQEMKRYDEAFSYWEQALKLDDHFLDAAFSMAFCYEELGDYRQAHSQWTQITAELDRRGLTVERKFPADRAEACLKKI